MTVVHRRDHYFFLHASHDRAYVRNERTFNTKHFGVHTSSAILSIQYLPARPVKKIATRSLDGDTAGRSSIMYFICSRDSVSRDNITLNRSIARATSHFPDVVFVRFTRFSNDAFASISRSATDAGVESRSRPAKHTHDDTLHAQLSRRIQRLLRRQPSIRQFYNFVRTLRTVWKMVHARSADNQKYIPVSIYHSRNNYYIVKSTMCSREYTITFSIIR